MQAFQRVSTRLRLCRRNGRYCARLNSNVLRHNDARGLGTNTLNNLATAAHNEELHPNHDIYVSTSTDPYFNLSFEDWLFRHSPESKPLLLIYRDSPCVVIGRNQNPWTEVNFAALSAANVPFLRRRSGGGAVYHDLGNTNFSIHLPRASFDRHATGRLVLRAIQSLGIDAHLNDRNDICVGPDKMRSAYKLVNKRGYHHGTMLLTTKLDDLGDFLRTQTINMVTEGVASVRSPVCNLKKYSVNATHDNFTNAVTAEFRKEYGVTSDPCIVTDSEGSNIEYIRRGMQELDTWDWSFGQTPKFIHTLNKSFTWGDVMVEIRSKHGLVLDVVLSGTDVRMTAPCFEKLVQDCRVKYTGRRYGLFREVLSSADPNTPRAFEDSQPLRDIDSWLQTATYTA
ncbi:Lipoyltransferase and lipoate-protein ligase [Pholiota conissans]|uniref:Putative lipoate-protein ligase A n=1 Tax=Pholiota conissans TaxID=109636 RepID=A0A9P5Z1P9_9AGAR|nr:Lipoyltransferase and lipoate-protein ligase [Pholiota conissans]